MLLSLVIPSLSTKQPLQDMLSSLVTHRPKTPYEVIVVDMSSTDGTLQMLETQFPDVRVLRDTPNKGYGAAANAGMTEAQGTHIFVCNSDLLFREGNVDDIARKLAAVGDDALLGFRLENADGGLQRSALNFPARMDLAWMFSAYVRASYNRVYRMGKWLPDWDITQTTPVDWVTGAALAASRSLFDRLGGFDEAFFMFSEETDLCRRVHDLGGTVLYVPEVAITHVGGATLSNADLRVKWITAGKVRYTRKHYGHLVLFAARLGATVAYLTSYPVWLLSWLRHGLTASEVRAEIRRWSKALVEAWRV